MEVLVWGASHNNTLGLVRSLGEMKHIVYVLLFKDTINFVAFSRYVEKVFFTNHDEEIDAQIISICKRLKTKPLLLCTSDETATYINNHAAELKPYCFFESGNDINKYRNKDVGNELAIRCGLQIPQTWVLQSKSVPVEGIQFPLILKANNSTKGGKAFLQKINDPESLVSVLSIIPDDCYPVQLQKYIKKEYEMMLLGCSLAGGTVVHIPVAQRKFRFFPNEYNAGSFSHSVNPNSSIQLVSLQKRVSEYLEAIEYTGLFSAEFVYEKGVYYFLEINLRNDGTSYLSTKSGFNLPHMLCEFFEKGKTEIVGNFSESFYMANISDFGNVINKRLSLWTWLKDVKRADCFSHYNRKDVLPYFGFLLSFIIKKIKRL
jgi:predicted ATP-grasp superfamily ATP-dependent carboligase